MAAGRTHPLISGKISLRIGRHTLDIQAQVPDAPVHLDEVLPLWRVLTDAVVAVGVADAESEGGKVTCSKGCGACCCQLVPVTLPEAFALAALVEDWPEERRTDIAARFAAVQSGLAASGWLERWNALLDRPTPPDNQEFIALGLEYFRLGLPCPFLEEQACSVYPDRPLICRQFLALSDPVHCREPSPETMRTVTLPARPNALLGRMAREAGYGAAFVPLGLLPAVMSTRPPRGVREAGKTWAERLFRALSEKELPPETPMPLMGA